MFEVKDDSLNTALLDVGLFLVVVFITIKTECLFKKKFI